MAESLPQAMENLCAAAEEYNASDLLLHEGRPPQIRIGGSLTPLEYAPLDSLFFDALWRACGARTETQDHDSSLTSGGGVRFRVNLLRQLGQRAAVLRRIRSEIPDMETLGVPAELLRDWITQSVRPDLGLRADRFGKKHDAGGVSSMAERKRIPPCDHDRRSD